MLTSCSPPSPPSLPFARCLRQACESVLEELGEWHSQLVQRLLKLDEEDDADAEERATLEDELESLTGNMSTKMEEKEVLKARLKGLKQPDVVAEVIVQHAEAA